LSYIVLLIVTALPFAAFLRRPGWPPILLLCIPFSWALYAGWLHAMTEVPALRDTSLHDTFSTIPLPRLFARVALTFAIFPAVYFVIDFLRALRFGRNMALCVLTQHGILSAVEFGALHVRGVMPDAEELPAMFWTLEVQQALTAIAGLALLVFAVLTLGQIVLRIVRGPARA